MINVNLTIAIYSTKAKDEIIRWSSEEEIKKRTLFSLANTNMFCYLLDTEYYADDIPEISYEIVLCINRIFIDKNIFLNKDNDIIIDGGIFKSWFYLLKSHTVIDDEWLIHFDKLLCFGDMDRPSIEFVIKMLEYKEQNKRIHLI